MRFKNKLLYSVSISAQHADAWHTVLAQNFEEENRGRQRERERERGDKRNESEMGNLISFITVVCR